MATTDDGGEGDDGNDGCDGDSDGGGRRRQSTKTAPKETAAAAAAAAAIIERPLIRNFRRRRMDAMVEIRPLWAGRHAEGGRPTLE